MASTPSGTCGGHEGYVERARNGTLFLDEVGNLPVATQTKLLQEAARWMGGPRSVLFERLKRYRAGSGIPD